MRARAIVLAGLLALGLAASGCALMLPPGNAPDVNRLGPARRLVVARITSEENRATAETASGLLLNSLRDAGDMLGSREFLAEARGLGLGLWATGMLDRVQTVGWPTADEGRVLREAFGITTLVMTDLTTYEQVWGKYAKFTRVGVGASGYDLATERVLWRSGKDVEVEEMRGRAFQYALEQAVQDLAEMLYPRTTFSVVNVWRYWRR